jgi:cytoplasmic iron level regulating protein YaaA (DUF328/UPF0246 family)
MLVVISPAKTLDFESAPIIRKSSQPLYLDDAQVLVEQLQQLAPHQLSSLMSISDKLGQLNYDRYQNWRRPFSLDNAKQALLAFKGDVYTGLNPEQFSQEDFAFAQRHLYILSGLYGALRPLDLIQPYRLEMGTRLANIRGANLYEFWGDRITESVNKAVKMSGSEVLVNLASNEYFKSIRRHALRCEVITPVFKENKGGNYKVVSFLAKKARGMLTAYIIRNRLDLTQDIKAFDEAGYGYNPGLSTAREWVFTRG